MNQNIDNESKKSEISNDQQKIISNSEDDDDEKQQRKSVEIDDNDEEDFLTYRFQKSYKQSPYLNTYIKQLLKGRQPPKVQALEQKLVNHKIIYMTQFQLPLKFQLSKIYESRNKKIMQFEVRFSYFIVYTKILNICPKDDLNVELKNWINSGVYGAVYEVEINKVKYAVKKMSLNKNSRFKDIRNAIEQYSIMKLCSALEIGPGFSPAFGFDMVVTEDSIYFSCQMGLSICEYSQNVSNRRQDFEKIFSKLEQSLILLHSLGIIHNDIKPNNIIYSLKYKKFCFIDFGLSEVTQSPLCSLKKVKPRGSLYYCSQQMKKLFLNNFCEGQVDLFYNDMIALQKSKQSMLSIIKSQGRMFLEQQNQINSKKVVQIINDDYSLLNDIKNSDPQQNQQHENYDYDRRKNNQLKLINNNQEVEQFRENGLQMVLIIRIIYLLIQKKVAQFQELIQANQAAMVKILSTNLKKISFVFFQTGKSPILLTIYKKLTSYISQYNLLPAQTIEIIQLRLQPYFCNKIDRQNKETDAIMSKYMLEEKNSKQIITKRYEEELSLFYNDRNIDSNVNNNNSLLLIEVPIKQITVFLTSDTITNFQPILTKLQQSINRAGNRFLIQMISYQNSKIEFYRVGTQVTQLELDLFETVLNKLGLKIKFKIKNNLQQQIQINFTKKYLYYLQLFMQFYFIKIKQYQFNSMIGRLIIHQMPSHSNIDIKLFKDLYLVIDGQYSQLKIQQKNIQNNEIIDYFRQSSAQNFQIFQMCLNIVDRLIKTLDRLLPYSINIQINDKFAFLMENKIRSCLLIQIIILKYIHINKQKQNIFISASFLNNILITKCLDFRRLTLCQKLSKAQEYNDFMNVIQSYESLQNIWDNLHFDKEPLKTQTKLFKLKQYLDNLIKRLMDNSQSYCRIEKQLFEVIIYTSLIPFEEYEKFNLLKRYYEIFKQQNSRKDKQNYSSYAQYYAVLKTFKLALQLDDFNTILNVFQYVEGRKSYVSNPRFFYSIYYFFKKCNNSKRIKQFTNNITNFKKTFINDDVLHFNFQHRITEIAKSTKKKQLVQQKWTYAYNKNDSLLNPVLEKQHQKNQIGNLLCQNQLRNICYQFLNQWNTTKSQHKEDRQIQTLLFNQKIILKGIFFSFSDLTALFKYFSRQYQLQIQRYEVLLCKKIEFLRERKKIKSQIWKFFGQGCLNEDQYWQKVKLSFILLTRSRLLDEITKNRDIIDNYHMQLIKMEWQIFDNAIKKIAPKQFQTDLTQKYSSLLTYFEVKTNFNRIIFFHELSKHNKSDNPIQIQLVQKIKRDYINSFIEYLKRAIIRFEKISKKIFNSNMEFRYFKTEKIISNDSLVASFRCQEPYNNMISDCFEGSIRTQEVEKEIVKQKIPKHFQQGFNSQNQLKKSFFDIVQSQQIHLLFYLYQFRIRFIQNLIQLGAKLILQGKKEEKMGCYFLTFMFYHIFQFVKKHNCSSYSYILIGMINSLQKKLENGTFKRMKDQQEEKFQQDFEQISLNQKKKIKQFKSDLILKLRLITQFQQDMIRFLIEEAKQQKIKHTILILLSCERVKFQIILFLIKNKLIFVKGEDGCQFQIDFKLIKKIQFIICDNGDKLEYLAKSFFKHTLYCYLVLINLGDKMLNVFESRLSGWLAFAIKKDLLRIYNDLEINQNKQQKPMKEFDPTNRYQKSYKNSINRSLQIKHFRSTRRISTKNQQKQQKKLVLFQLEQKNYYLIFQPINQQSLRKIPLYKNEQLAPNSNKAQQNITCNMIMNYLGKKVNKYLKNSCSNSYQ